MVNKRLIIIVTQFYGIYVLGYTKHNHTYLSYTASKYMHMNTIINKEYKKE